ncbi:MAG: serine/threonine protein kinase [Myxococcales bacterium]|nr:serine/threonine protein kinase [Myxococcales bacterium]
MSGIGERYRLTRRLATGGMAEVYLGLALGAEGFEKPVAIKRVHPHLARDPVIAEMFLSEARLAQHLHHQNVVEVFDVGKSADGLFIVMELVNGWELGEVSQALGRIGRCFPPALAGYLGSQVVAGLCHAYRQTFQGKPVVLAHRDVSPSNVLLSTEGEVKVADFGIAKLAALSPGTEPGTFKGKLAYAAPEVLEGQPATHAADQFALGAVLYELVSGRHPFGEVDQPLAYAGRIHSRAPGPLSGAPAELAGVIGRLLAKQPKERFPSMEEVSRALASYLAHAGEPATLGALADFLRGLELPPPIADRREEQPGSGTFLLEPSAWALGPALQGTIEFTWQPPGVAMDTGGKLVSEGAPLPLRPRPEPIAEPPAFALVPPDPPLMVTPLAEELELARPIERPIPPEAELPAPRGVGSGFFRKLVRAVATLCAVGLLLALGYLGWARYRHWMRSALPRPEAAVLLIDSEPAGATVFIEEVEIGQTPLALPNHYAPADIRYRLVRTGYKPYSGTFRGGEPASIGAKLRKR